MVKIVEAEEWVRQQQEAGRTPLTEDGKTMWQEGQDSARALGCAILFSGVVTIVVVLVVLWLVWR